MVTSGRSRFISCCLIKHALVLSAGVGAVQGWVWAWIFPWNWALESPQLDVTTLCCSERTVRLTSVVLWGAFLPISHILVFYMQSCFVVYDLSLVVSVSMMGFCALQGNGFVKHDTFICKYLQDLWCICVLYSLSSCGSCFYFGRSPEGNKKVQASFPHPWPLCVRASAEKPGRCGSGCRQYFHEIGVVLGSLWSQPGYCLGHLLPDREERAVGCRKRLLPALAGLGGTMRPSHSSHASPAHLDFGSEPGQPAKAVHVLLQGLDVGGESSTVALLPGLALSSSESSTSLRALGET